MLLKAQGWSESLFLVMTMSGHMFAYYIGTGWPIYSGGDLPDEEVELKDTGLLAFWQNKCCQLQVSKYRDEDCTTLEFDGGLYIDDLYISDDRVYSLDE